MVVMCVRSEAGLGYLGLRSQSWVEGLGFEI